MTTNISFNPNLTTSPQNTFLVQTEGYVQGAYFDDPSTKQWLTQGQVANSVIGAVWGGMALSEEISAVNSSQSGNQLSLATGDANLTAFSVFNQAYNMIITPGNSVQQSVSGMSAMYFRLGSNARIAVQCSPALAAALAGGATNQQVSWDYTNQMLISFNATIGALPVKVLSFNSNSKIVNNIGGALSWIAGNCAIIQI